MTQSHAKSTKKNPGSHLRSTSYQPNFTNYGWIACASQLVDPKWLPGFFHTFSMAFYHKWDVKNDFVYVLQFFSLISDGLGSVIILNK